MRQIKTLATDPFVEQAIDKPVTQQILLGWTEYLYCILGWGKISASEFENTFNSIGIKYLPRIIEP